MILKISEDAKKAIEVGICGLEDNDNWEYGVSGDEHEKVLYGIKELKEKLNTENVVNSGRDFLVFWVGDGSSSESRSTYYSRVTSASTKQMAIKKLIMANYNITDPDMLSECMIEAEESFSDYDAILCDTIRL